MPEPKPLSIVTEDELDAVESSWVKVPDVTHDEPPTTALAVKAHNYFVDKILLADAIASRCVEIGITGPVTKENYDKAKLIVGMCRKSRGDIERARKAANEDALAWQRAVNSRARELIEPIEGIEEPFKAGIKAIDDEKARLKAEKEEAERQAIIAAENAKREAEEASRKAERDAEALRFKADQERLAAERKAFEEQQAVAKRESDRIQAETAKKLADERAEMEAERKRLDDIRQVEEAERQRERDKIEAERQRQRAVVDEANRVERQRIADELAELKRQRDEADAKERERIAKDAAAKAELERIEREAEEAKRRAARAPDADKLREWAKAIRELAYDHADVGSEEAKAVVERIRMALDGAAEMAELFA